MMSASKKMMKIKNDFDVKSLNRLMKNVNRLHEVNDILTDCVKVKSKEFEIE